MKKPEKIKASTGFEPVTSEIPVRCSTNWAMKPHIGSEAILFNLPWEWCHDDAETLAFNVNICLFMERRSLKKSRLQRDLNPWPPRYRCDALPTELWSHTLGARPIYRYRGGHGFESCWNLDFFRLLFSNCLNWKIYCDDHSSLWLTVGNSNFREKFLGRNQTNSQNIL